MKRAIVRADQSPMNAKRWLLELGCGHEAWVTQGSRPKAGKNVECPRCERVVTSEPQPTKGGEP